MTAAQWLASADGDALLAEVGGRLTPRQWLFLAAAEVRRLADVLPDGPVWEAVDAVERAGPELSAAARADWGRRVAAAEPAADAAAERAMWELVRTADPEAADVAEPVLTRHNQIAPAFPLFRDASRRARDAIGIARTAVSDAAEAVRRLLDPPGPEAFRQVVRAVHRAANSRVGANAAANAALRLKRQGDELADRAAASRNKRLDEARAEQMARAVEDYDPPGPSERAARKHLADLVREVVGNPFAPPPFDPAWRTDTVLALARGIFADRAFDRLPVLADALLDADCDSEPLLRHLRGTEVGAKGPPRHVRGCWAVERVVGPG